MRGNGLTAADYAPLAVLGRSVAADALLALRDAGVAAYAVPRQAQSPASATLFADRTALHRARAIVRELAPDAVPAEEAPAVDEVAWQQIVSGFSASADEPAPDAPQGETAPSGPYAEPPPREPHPLVRDDGDHFVPGPMPPPPQLDLVSRLAWSGVLGGPLLMLSAALISWSPPGFVVLVCVLGFILGMTTLVLRMKDRPPTDDGPDDGAVV